MAVVGASPPSTPATMRVDVRVLLTASAFFAGAAAIVLLVPATTEARVIQHFLSIGIQIGAAGVSAMLAQRAGAPYWVGSREGLVWIRTSVAACLWAAALVAQVVGEWLGRGPAYPSISDVLFLASVSVLTVTIGVEFVRARWMLSQRQQLAFYAVTVVLWALAMGVILWPAMMIPDSFGEAVTFLYATTAVLLFVLAVNLAVIFRVVLIGSGWTGMAAGAGLLAIAVLGTIHFNWLGMYSPSHPINLVRIGAFCLLGGSAAWHSDAWRARIYGRHRRRGGPERPSA